MIICKYVKNANWYKIKSVGISRVISVKCNSTGGLLAAILILLSDLLPLLTVGHATV